MIVSAFTIAWDALVIILTWIKTAGIKKSLSQVGVNTSLTMLLLRDGEFSLLFYIDNPVQSPHRYNLLLVGCMPSRETWV